MPEIRVSQANRKITEAVYVQGGSCLMSPLLIFKSLALHDWQSNPGGCSPVNRRRTRVGTVNA